MPADSVELPRALKPLLGTVVAKRYVVDGFLGMGGMAVVFSGRHATLDRKVAIKFMRPEYSLNEDVSRRFDREARAASNFEHPNCIEVFDCGETNHGLKFIVMPLLEGVELGSVLGEPFPPAQAVWFGIQLLRGLEHAHGHGVVHRDLKPDNIFVTLDHERRELLKIVDFGIAKLLEKQVSDGLQTKVGAIVGTPAYMSPEQAMGTGIDARADLYSLGVILYHMLAGKAPFRAADPRGLLFQQVSMEAKPLPGSVPELVTRLVTALMAKERDDRPPSATAALAAFERVWRQLQSDKTPWIQLVKARPSAHPAAGLPTPPPASARRTPSPAPSAPAAGGTQIYRPEDIPKAPLSPPQPPVLQPAARGVARPRASTPPPPPPARSDPNNLDQMDAALRKFLDGQTITAEDNLRSGIFDVPDGGWGDNLLLPGQRSDDEPDDT